jgi:hypothetical protein
MRPTMVKGRAGQEIIAHFRKIRLPCRSIPFCLTKCYKWPAIFFFRGLAFCGGRPYRMRLCARILIRLWCPASACWVGWVSKPPPPPRRIGKTKPCSGSTRNRPGLWRCRSPTGLAPSPSSASNRPGASCSTAPTLGNSTGWTIRTNARGISSARISTTQGGKAYPCLPTSSCTATARRFIPTSTTRSRRTRRG